MGGSMDEQRLGLRWTAVKRFTSTTRSSFKEKSELLKKGAGISGKKDERNETIYGRKYGQTE